MSLLPLAGNGGVFIVGTIGILNLGAIAGGNRVILKPSEVASHTSKILAKLIPKYLDPEIVAVVEG